MKFPKEYEPMTRRESALFWALSLAPLGLWAYFAWRVISLAA